MVCVLKGSFVFAADLSRPHPLPLGWSFSAGAARAGGLSGGVITDHATSNPIQARRVARQDIVNRAQVCCLLELLRTRLPHTIRYAPFSTSPRSCTPFHRLPRFRSNQHVVAAGSTKPKVRNLPTSGFSTERIACRYGKRGITTWRELSVRRDAISRKLPADEPEAARSVAQDDVARGSRLFRLVCSRARVQGARTPRRCARVVRDAPGEGRELRSHVPHVRNDAHRSESARRSQGWLVAGLDVAKKRATSAAGEIEAALATLG